MFPRLRVGLQFHVQVALATQNSALAAIVEKMWTQRVHNPYWKKLHEHIDLRTVDNWCDDHDQILKALLRKDPNAAKLAMWQHLENTKQMLFNETAMTLNLMPIATYLPKTQSFISIPQSTARNKALSLRRAPLRACLTVRLE
ncbi:Hexuronate utilization operon transcriptional repressor ExuR [Klebsiella pneumoniae]|uniref:Hexuronate utilization operon transcriptional repressor ExuR n=1 Tax=Klebsiella pneumoniae TaxID=573 RepID=A0A377U0R9_KLEPN|nr:Hexuronate utilization operon transcriptional repressor ExuR [Klebsiella pneumoniae]